ncbi:hypothetical protein SLE2022_124160 [Rubroshorea leprosula]
MAGGVRKISAASARAHTGRAKRSASFKLPSGIFTKILVVFLVGIAAWAYKAIQPPPPKICGSPDGPPVTAPRIKLRDGWYLAYKEHGVPRNAAKYKIVYVHGFDSCRHDAVVAKTLSLEVVEDLGIYILSFDRPGYGESDPNPRRMVKSMALDIEELADQLGLGSKFYVIGSSMGGQVIWSYLKYIPHRSGTIQLLAPVVNYWWPGFPANLSKKAYHEQLPQDQWALPHSTDVLSRHDKELIPKLSARKEYVVQVRHQGEYESLHCDIIVGFGNWEFDPMSLENPFPNNEGSVHIWHGDEDAMVPVMLQHYIAQQLPWVHYHELAGAGHLFQHADGMSNNIIKTLLIREK